VLQDDRPLAQALRPGRPDVILAQGVVLVLAIVIVFVNLLVDLAYAYLDPRIRFA
jgi:peptide/nickel transport system permease protein